MMRKIFGLFLAMTFLLCAFVSADTYINVSIEELAHQNVTFAEFFDLEETVYDALVQGWINVSNPSNEDVSDLTIYLNNLSNLQTNVTWYSGRNGTQTVLMDSDNQSVTYSNAITTTPQPFDESQDLDHDNMTDFMWVNGSHLIFDFSSEHAQKSYYVADLTTSPQSYTRLNIPIVLSNGKTVGWFNVTESSTSATYQLDPNTLIVTEGPNDDYVVLHIPELRSGDSTMFTYNATGVIDPPLDVNTTYDHEQLTKVLAGECFNVTQYATDVFFHGLNLTNVNITMQMKSVMWNGSEFNFTFNELLERGDWTNVSNSSNITWYWGVNGGNMTYDETYNISYSVCAPASVPNSSTYMFLQEMLQYQTGGTVTGLDLEDIKGRSGVVFNFTKRIDTPQDTEHNTNVTWEVEPTVGAVKNITFNVTKVTLWVSQTEDPNTFTTHKKRYYPGEYVNETQLWNSYSAIGERWYFNYTDGSEPNSPPPIIWMMPYYHIADTDSQIQRTFATRNGSDYYFKYIYVVNGYWLEIQKNVTNIGEDQYNISLFVWNRGNGYTPRDLTVTIYDFVPEEFDYSDFDPNYDGISDVSGSFNGTSFYWDVPPTRTVQNASFAPAGYENSTWNATYLVNGTGDYRVSELYIVGLDPRLVDGGSSHEVISVMSSLMSSSTELVYVMIVLALITINVVNYIITRRKE